LRGVDFGEGMTVYTETVIHGAPTYQIAIIDVSEGVRVTGRIEGDRVAIGDAVVELEARDGVRYFSGLRP
jgi:uncharacterized OB-fold protein